MRQPGQRIKSNMLCIVCVQVFLNLGAFFCHAYRRAWNGLKMMSPGDLQDQNIQQLLADSIRTVLIIAHLVQHLLKKLCNIGGSAEVTENLCARLFFLRLKCNSINGKNIVFQRKAWKGLLCMFQIGRNNDQIPCIDGLSLITEKELPFTVNNIKNLCKMVCVQQARPVSFIFGR